MGCCNSKKQPGDSVVEEAKLIEKKEGEGKEHVEEEHHEEEGRESHQEQYEQQELQAGHEEESEVEHDNHSEQETKQGVDIIIHEESQNIEEKEEKEVKVEKVEEKVEFIEENQIDHERDERNQKNERKEENEEEDEEEDEDRQGVESSLLVDTTTQDHSQDLMDQDIQIQIIEPEVEADFHQLLGSDDDLIEDPNLGTIYFSITYDGKAEELTICVKKITNLPSTDLQGTCSSFVVVSLFPDPQHKYSYQTEVQKANNDPIFNEVFRFSNITSFDMERKSAIFLVQYTDKTTRNYVIGEVGVKLSKIGTRLSSPIGFILRKKPKANPLPITITTPIEISTNTLISTSPNNNTNSITTNQSPIPNSFLDVKEKKRANDENSIAPSFLSSLSTVSTSAIVKKHDYGKIHISTNYKSAKKILQIVIVSAKLNPSPGNPSLPNPYVKLYILPDPSKKTKHKTTVQKSTLEPMYNENFDFKIEQGTENKRVQITVWDHDSFGRNQFLGEALIQVSNIRANEISNKWVELESLSYGEIYVQIKYTSATDYLSISVIRARGLNGGRKVVDPYAKAYLLPDKRKQTKKKTKTLKQTNDPEFNETFDYFLAEVDNSKARYLQVAVVDSGSVGGHEVIGSFSVLVNDIMEAHDQVREQWFPLIKDKIDKK